jgi:hypothetical protein
LSHTCSLSSFLWNTFFFLSWSSHGAFTSRQCTSGIGQPHCLHYVIELTTTRKRLSRSIHIKGSQSNWIGPHKSTYAFGLVYEGHLNTHPCAHTQNTFFPLVLVAISLFHLYRKLFSPSLLRSLLIPSSCFRCPSPFPPPRVSPF